MEPEYTRTPGASIPFVVFVDNGINPATTSNPYNYLFEFVEVAGLIGFNLETIFIPRSGLSTNNNLDYMKTPGSYRISGGATNCPVTNGFLLIFSQNGTCLQLCVSSTASSMYIRIYWTTSWFDWIQIK